MKKILLTLVSIVMSFSVLATDSIKETNASDVEGKYTTLNKPETEKPQVIEFFSFYCGACFQFDQSFEISKKIKTSLPENVEYHKYHVSFMGGEMGTILTQAWGVAIVLNVEEKIKPLMFDAVQKKRSIKSLKDVRDVFIEVGVNGEEFDSLWDSFVIKSLLSKQLQEAVNMDLTAVPAIYVNGKYLLNPEGITSIQDYIDVTKYLATQK